MTIVWQSGDRRRMVLCAVWVAGEAPRIVEFFPGSWLEILRRVAATPGTPSAVLLAGDGR